MGSVYVCKAVTVKKKKQLARNLAYLNIACNFFLKNMRKLNGGRAVADLKKTPKLSAADEEYLEKK